MSSQDIVRVWFDKWTAGDYTDLPISDDFSHKSPFDTINGKEAYLDLVRKNESKFLGYTFDIHDGIYQANRACVRYTAIQGSFQLDVSEWYYLENELIKKIISYYHIGEIRKDRKLES